MGKLKSKKTPVLICAYRKGVMSGLEIMLVIIAIILVTLSFVFSEKVFANSKTQDAAGTLEISREDIKKRVDLELNEILDEKLEETEVKLDKITNIKIMAVGDYSDNVIKDINKNHDEVMFLFEMLIDKEKSVKNIIREIENIKRSIKNIDANNEKNVDKNKEEIDFNKEISKDDNRQKNKQDIITEKDFKEHRQKSINNNKQKLEEASDYYDKLILNNARNDSYYEDFEHQNSFDFNQEQRKIESLEENPYENKNEKILELNKKGKSTLEIAKSLGLGMGEVKLVIDLNKSKSKVRV